MTATATSERFVLDGSVTLAWLFHDEKDPYADAIVAKLPNVEMLVPRLWHLEIANILLVGERRKRCSQADSTQWLLYLAGLPIVVDDAMEARAWSETINLARQHDLTAYDASYLELAIREGVPIATLDAPLKAAARAPWRCALPALTGSFRAPRNRDDEGDATFGALRRPRVSPALRQE
jgi:predicted nucleic acid-binding protein